MKAEIISIGDELLIGQTINTNAGWMGKELSGNGIDVVRVTTIKDTKEDIIAAVNEAMERADFTFITGGLGPTKDDITKFTLAEMFDSKLILNDEILERIADFFEKRGRKMLQSNIDQAKLPEKCKVVTNYNGTASGMWFEKNGSHVISMPGVPYEMKAMMTDQILPVVYRIAEVATTFTETRLIQGIGESFLAEIIKDWENEVRAEGFSLAYLPSPGIIRMRITFDDEKDQDKVNTYFERLQKLVPKNFVGSGDLSLEQHIGTLLLDDNESIGTVESCTGGYLASLLTKHSGSSSFYKGSMLTYANEAKKNMVSVSDEILRTRGAVSEEAVLQMAKEGRARLNVDWCLSTSGIAGPGGGTKRKPVGFVWIAVAGPNGILKAKSFQFGDNRERNIKMTALSALNMLRIAKLNIENE